MVDVLVPRLTAHGTASDDGRALVYDSATGVYVHTELPQAEGGGGAALITPKPGDLLSPAFAGGTFNGSCAAGLFTSGPVHFAPIVITREVTVDALVTYGEGEPGGSIDVRILVYDSDTHGYPLSLHATATFSAAGGGILRVATLASPVAFPPGLYWATIRNGGGGTLGAWRCVNSAQVAIPTINALGATRTPVPFLDPGTVSSPTDTFSAWSWSDSLSNVIPHVALRGA